MIGRELDRYLPFLATTKVLVAAVPAVSAASRPRPSRSTIAVALALQEAATNDLASAWRPTPASAWTGKRSMRCWPTASGFVDAAPRRVEAFVRQVEAMVADHPDAARYRPEQSSAMLGKPLGESPP